MRLLIVGLCVVPFVLVACRVSGDEGPLADDSDATSTEASVSSVASAESVKADDTTLQSPSHSSSELSCDNERYLDGDFDGDGAADRVYLEESPSSLVVCSSAGSHVLEVGQLELLMVSDVDLDGRDEILAGGTTAWGEGVEIVALVDQRLDFIVDSSGLRLSLWRGLPPDRVLASGCGFFTATDSRQIAILDGTVNDAKSVEWQRTIYRIDGHRAVEVSIDTGTFDASGSSDPLSTAPLQDLVGEPC